MPDVRREMYDNDNFLKSHITHLISQISTCNVLIRELTFVVGANITEKLN